LLKAVAYFRELSYRIVKNEIAIKEQREHILSEAADVGNIDMMIADIYDAL
jgi:hypothetical protein